METTQLTFTFKQGATPAQMAERLRWQAGLLEGMAPKAAASVKNTSPVADEDDGAEKEADDEDFASTPKSKTQARIAKAFDQDEGEEEEKAPAKAPKAKKLTANDVNDACKKRASGGRREEVLKILKKQFKVASVSELDEADYADVIAAMEE